MSGMRAQSDSPPDASEQENLRSAPAVAVAWLARVSRGILAGMLAALLVALVDAVLARVGVAESSRAPSLLALWAADLGVIAPVALSVAVLFACGALLAHPNDAPSWRALRAWLKPQEPADRLTRALLVPLAMFAGLGWVVAMANSARALLSSIQGARASGAAMACAALLLGALGLSLVFVLFGLLRRLLNDRPVQSSWAAPSVTIPVAVLVCMAIVAHGIVSGSTGGEGGVLGFLGVLKRAELDLKPPALLLLVGLCGYAFASPLQRVWPPLALLIALAPLGFTLRAARSLDNEPKVVSAIESHASLGRPALRLVRKLTDRDHDGASPYFGGGDCNDHNPEINPMASDIPGNGIDEDCSGQDLALPARSPIALPSDVTAPLSDATDRIPSDLNLLLLSIDTLRWDLGYAGYPRPITPSLDKLAAKSVVFETFYALASYTGKSIGPLMCGKYPSETSRGWSHYNTYPKTDRMVQERLKAAGVFTMAVHSHWYFKAWSGLGRGFELLDFSAAPPEGIDATTDTSIAADRLSDSAIKVLSKPENTSKKFFAWVHYFDPHADYMRHKNVPDFGNLMRDRYDHEVRFTDDQVGRLLEFVESQPWGKKTAIVVTSDHGEAFLEHGMIRHGYELWEELVRVPLIIFAPGIQPKRITTRRSAIDMVPTILDLMRAIPDKPKDKSDFVSGVSLVPDLLLEPGKEPEPRDIFIDMPAGPNNDERRCFIHGDRKLTISNGVRYQLFDLASDPAEKNDLSENKDLLRANRALYDAFRTRLHEVFVKRPEDE